MRKFIVIEGSKAGIEIPLKINTCCFGKLYAQAE